VQQTAPQEPVPVDAPDGIEYTVDFDPRSESARLIAQPAGTRIEKGPRPMRKVALGEALGFLRQHAPKSLAFGPGLFSGEPPSLGYLLPAIARSTPSIETLVLPHKLDPKCLASLARFARLRELWAWHATDDWMDALGSCPTLESVTFGEDGLTDRGITRLAQVPHLKSVALIKVSSVTDVGIAGLGRLQLKNLVVHGCNISGEFLGSFSGSSLETLHIEDCGITDGAFAEAIGLEHLQEVWIRGCPRITNRTLSHLSRLTWLTRLEVTAPEISDEGIQVLASLRSAKSIGLGGCTTETGRARLRASLPGCDVHPALGSRK
jgi:hypothetical protein